MRTNLLMLVVVAAMLTSCASAAADCSTVPASARLQPVGYFSDMDFTEEHQYGSALHLWTTNGCLIGLFDSASGLAGDTPTGLLEDLVFVGSTGYLKFRARMTTGWEGPGQPSHDIVEFTGNMKGEVIVGLLSWGDARQPNRKRLVENVVLRKVEDDVISDTETYGEWVATVGEILRFRGPKW